MPNGGVPTNMVSTTGWGALLRPPFSPRQNAHGEREPYPGPGRTMSFGHHLRALREGAGLTRAALARKTGVPASTLRRWERDQGFPGLPTLVRLAAALGVPVERFAEGVEDPHDDEPETQQPI
jgi:DNA-binding XRE family transcriptional regulator